MCEVCEVCVGRGDGGRGGHSEGASASPRGRAAETQRPSCVFNLCGLLLLESSFLVVLASLFSSTETG